MARISIFSPLRKVARALTMFLLVYVVRNTVKRRQQTDVNEKP